MHLRSSGTRTLRLFAIILLFLLVGRSAHAQFRYPPDDPRLQGFPSLNVADFGAVGDGESDDTAAIQRAVDTAVKGDRKVIFFPPGTYLVSSVRVAPGLTLITFSATMKVKPEAGEFNVVFTTFNHRDRASYFWSSDSDSPPLVIYGFKYDGNAAEQGEYANFQLQHQAFVALAADGSKRGRLLAHVFNCEGWDGVGDFVYVYTNVELEMASCKATDVFRGMLSVGAGRSIVRGYDLTAEGERHPTGIDLEPTVGSGALDVRLSRIRLKGDFDVAVQPGSSIQIDDLHSGPPFNLVNRGSTINISNSRFELGTPGDGNRIRARESGGTTQFTNCDFYAIREESGSANTGPLYAMRVNWRPTSSSQVIFDGCRFHAGDGATAAVYSEPDQQELGNELVLRNCQIGPDFAYGVLMEQGGNFNIVNTTLNSRTGIFLDHRDGHYYRARMEAIGLGPQAQHYMRVDHGDRRNTILHQAVEMTASQNVIWNPGGNVSANRFGGQRTIRGDDDPTTSKTPGFLGDIYIRRTKDLEERWQCIATDTQQARWIPLYSRSIN
jgi:hypothetical protein